MSNEMTYGEGAVFGLLVVVFKYLAIPFYYLLLILYVPCKILVLPMLLLLIMFSALWMICLCGISLAAMIARGTGVLRPIAFLIALPFVIIAAIAISLAPVPNLAGNIEKFEKFKLLFHFVVNYPRLTLREAMLSKDL